MHAPRTLVAVLGVASVMITACTTLAPQPRHPPTLSSGPARIELTQVPFYPQVDDQCGPAALAMALTHAGVARTPEQLRDEVYLPLRQGSLPMELVSAVRRTGLTPQVLSPQLPALLQALAQGRPVIVLMNVRWRLWPQWHYAVVVGYDLPHDQIVLRSGLEERHTLSLSAFDAQWANAERWGLVVWPPAAKVAPRSAQPPALMHAVSAPPD